MKKKLLTHKARNVLLILALMLVGTLVPATSFAAGGWTLENNGSHYIYVLKGDDFTMEAGISPADADVSYQWFKYEEQDGSWDYYPISGDAAKKAKYTVEDYNGKYAEYKCVVTDNDDSSISDALYVEVYKEQDWTLENNGSHYIYVLKGDDFTMEADVSPADADVTYQWQKYIQYPMWEYVDITGEDAKKAKYTITNYDGDDVTYRCVVTDKDDPSIKDYVEISLYKKNSWSLKDYWKEMKALEGSDFTMEVEVNPATANVRYQWYKDGIELAGQTAAKYTVPSYDGKYAEYRCVVTDKDDTSFSKTMDVEVYKGTSWKLENNNSEEMKVPYGSDFTLEALVSPADADVTYRWYKDGKLILGEDARKAKYTVTNYDGINVKYACEVTDKADDTLYEWFEVYISRPDRPWEVISPAYSGRLPFNGSPYKMSVGIEYMRGSAADFSFTYKWQKRNDYNVWKDIPGATGNSYSTTEVGNYRCVITDGTYSYNEDFYVYEKASYPWNLDTKWSSYMVNIGDTVTLKGYIEMEEGNKESDWGLKYSWTKKEVDKPYTEKIAGANGPTLSVKVACNAYYTLTVTDKDGNTKKESFSINIDERYAAVMRFVVMVDDLPDVDKLTLADKAAVNAAAAAYEALSLEEKYLVSASGSGELVTLQEAQKQIARLQKAADDATRQEEQAQIDKAKQEEQAQINAAMLKKVAGFSVKAQKGKKAKVKWKKAAGVSGYEVYRASKKNGKYKNVKVITKASTTSFTDKKLKVNKRYFYKIRPYTVIGGQKIYGKYSAVKKIKAK